MLYLKRSPSGPAYTFNGFSDKPGTGRIDYIFVRSGMKVLDHKTLIKKGKRDFYIRPLACEVDNTFKG